MKYFDAHCDTITTAMEKGEGFAQNNLHISFQQAQQMKPYGQIFAVWVDDRRKGKNAYAFVEKGYDFFLEQLAKNKEKMMLCTKIKDLIKGEQTGKCMAVLSLEGGHGLGGEVDNVEVLYQKGFRMITLTWNDENDLAYGCFAKTQEGLKPLGKAVIEKMKQRNMYCDVSHLNEKGFWEVAESGCPMIATHSNSKRICNHVRNLTDDQFKCLIEKGSGAGINFNPPFVGENANVFALVQHIEHFLSLGGENNLFIGADFDGITTIVDGILGIGDLSVLQNELLKLNYKEELIDKIFYDNLKKIVSKVL